MASGKSFLPLKNIFHFIEMSSLDSGVSIPSLQEELKRHAEEVEKEKQNAARLEEEKKKEREKYVEDLLTKPKQEEARPTKAEKTYRSFLSGFKSSTSKLKQGPSNLPQKDSRRISPLSNLVTSTTLEKPSPSIEMPAAVEETPLSAISEKSMYRFGVSNELVMNPLEHDVAAASKRIGSGEECEVNKLGQTKLQCFQELLRAQRQFVDQLEALNNFFHVTLPGYKSTQEKEKDNKNSTIIGKITNSADGPLVVFFSNVPPLYKVSSLRSRSPLLDMVDVELE